MASFQIVTAKGHRYLRIGESFRDPVTKRPANAASRRGPPPPRFALAGVDVTRLTSQHFWDQMHRVPIAAVAAVETTFVARVLAAFDIPVDTVL